MEDEVPLFDLVYEQRPPGSNWNHRLKVKSLSVECVYNQQLLQKILGIDPISFVTNTKLNCTSFYAI